MSQSNPAQEARWGILRHGSLVVVFVASFFLVKFAYSLGEGGISPRDEDRIANLPYEELRPAKGGDLRAILAGKPTVIWIIEANNYIQLEYLRDKLSTRTEHPVNWVLISQQVDVVPKPEGQELVYLSPKSFTDMLRLFKSNTSIPSWFIYDGRGVLRTRGFADSVTFSGELRSVVDGASSVTDGLIRESSRQQIESEVASLIASAGLKRVPSVAILFLDDLNSTCLDFAATEAAIKWRKSGEGRAVLLVPMGKQQTTTAQTMIANHDLPFRAAAPTPGVVRWWNSFEASTRTLNGTALLFKEGQITRAAAYGKTIVEW